MKIEKENFGRLTSGEKVIKYKLSNEILQVNVLNYGGIITEIYAPDKKGRKENIVLGFDDLAAYEDKSPYFGAIIGPNAGRIEGARFKLEGKEYKLETNEGNNNLHGGWAGLDKKIWTVTELDNGLQLKYVSSHLEGGFPGEIEFNVKYLLKGNELVIKYEGKPDRRTILNLTNHTYFNLSGDLKRSILDHKLKINADKFLPIDDQTIPTGEKRATAETPFDFRDFKRVGKDIDADVRQIKLAEGYDHPFVLSKWEKAIILKEEEAGRALIISTDQPVVVFYSGNLLGSEGELSKGVTSKPRLGLCLETQDFPNAINEEKFPTKTYDSENNYQSVTKYKFTTIEEKK